MRTKQFIVRVDNIVVKGERIHVFEASATKELMDNICAYFEISEKYRDCVQLWSGQQGISHRVRLDEMDEIPDTYEIVWIKGVLKNPTL